MPLIVYRYKVNFFNYPAHLFFLMGTLLPTFYSCVECYFSYGGFFCVRHHKNTGMVLEGYDEIGRYALRSNRTASSTEFLVCAKTNNKKNN
jgi:hypothetical protein